MYECFKVSVENHIAHIVLSRPDKRNSMINAFWRELYTIVDKIDREALARVIVISSTGPHFSSGMDVSVFKSVGSSGNATESEARNDSAAASMGSQRAARFYQTVSRLQNTFTRLEKCRLPVLVAVQGGCIGAGLDLITACDCRYATRDAFFTIFETNLAMTADVGTFPRICKLIPDGLARELAYTGRNLSADDAIRCGLVNRLYDTREELLDDVLDVASTIASKAPMAVYGCKRMILHARDHSVADTLDYVGVWNSGFFQRQEVAEAMAANTEKRQGIFAPLPAMPADNDPDADIEI